MILRKERNRARRDSEKQTKGQKFKNFAGKVATGALKGSKSLAGKGLKTSKPLGSESGGDAGGRTKLIGLHRSNTKYSYRTNN